MVNHASPQETDDHTETCSNELSSVLTAKQVSDIIADPTQISSSTLGLTPSEQAAALLAYSEFSFEAVSGLTLVGRLFVLKNANADLL